MIRRWSNGQFRDRAPLADVPLFECALHAKSERVAKGNVTRRRNRIRAALEKMGAQPRSSAPTTNPEAQACRPTSSSSSAQELSS